jgi:hypothetical protein
VSGVTFDPVSGDILATVLTVSRIVRVTAAGLVTDFAPAGTVAAPNSLDVDTNGDLIVGGNAGAIFRVPARRPGELARHQPERRPRARPACRSRRPTAAASPARSAARATARAGAGDAERRAVSFAVGRAVH